MSFALTLAVIAALLLGGSDFFAARSALTTPSLTVTRTAVMTSVTLSPIALLVVHSRWTWRDSLIGGIGGIAMITGLILLYHGYKVARMGVVAPLASVLLAAVPVVWDLINGITPSATSAVGMAFGVVALVLTSYTPGGEGSASLGVVLGLTSGIAFGVAFTLMGEVSSGAGIAPVVVQRSTGLVVLLVFFALRKEPLFAKGVGLGYGVLAGALGLTAICNLQLAFQRGDSGPVSVASSQFAAVAVVLAVLFNKERMRWWQAVGVVVTALAVALIALGQ